MTPRGYVYLALAVLIGLALWRGGDALYDAGAAAERAVWVEAQAKADKEAEAQRRASQGASDAASDEAAAGARQDSQAARDQTTTTIETIRYVYRDQPPAACPPAAVPDGVRVALGEAYDAARAAAR